MVCLEDKPSGEFVTLCAKGHRFCADCAWPCCKGPVESGLVPACPHEREHHCGTVPKAAAEAALALWIQQPDGQKSARKAELGESWGLKESWFSRTVTSAKVSDVYLSAERAAAGAVQCIGNKCKLFHIPPVPHSQEPQRIVCTAKRCGASFCAACRHPYHYRTACAEALRVNARWLRFLQEELGPFLIAATRVNEPRYGPLLKAHAKSKGALDEATRDAVARFNELRKMEIWKEKHCRHCPHCRRVVEKMSGCDAMRCGDDAHGGNQQRGCGQAFAWSQAPPYHADLRAAAREGGDGSGVVDLDHRLQLDAKEVHMLCVGSPVVCDGCVEPIVGPRLQCLHCERVDLCIGCVGKAAHGRAFKLRDGRTHPKDHVFRRVRQGPVSGAHSGSSIVEVYDGPPIRIDLVASAADGVIDLVGSVGRGSGSGGGHRTTGNSRGGRGDNSHEASARRRGKRPMEPTRAHGDTQGQPSASSRRPCLLPIELISSSDEELVEGQGAAGSAPRSAAGSAARSAAGNAAKGVKGAETICIDAGEAEGGRDDASPLPLPRTPPEQHGGRGKRARQAVAAEPGPSRGVGIGASAAATPAASQAGTSAVLLLSEDGDYEEEERLQLAIRASLLDSRRDAVTTPDPQSAASGLEVGVAH